MSTKGNLEGTKSIFVLCSISFKVTTRSEPLYNDKCASHKIFYLLIEIFYI